MMITAPAAMNRGRRDCGSGPDCVDSRAGASERAVTVENGSVRRGSEPDHRRDLACEGLQALRGWEVAEPEHELSAPRVDEGLHLLGNLRGSTDQVVAHVLRVGSSPASERASARRFEPLLHIRLGVEDPAIGAVRANNRVEVASDLLAVPAQQCGLADEAVEPDLPVGLVRMTRLDPQRHLLASAADPQFGQLLQRLRIAIGAVERQVLALIRDGLFRPEPLHDFEGLFENLQPYTRTRERVAVRLVLALVPSRAQTEDEAAVREHID